MCPYYSLMHKGRRMYSFVMVPLTNKTTHTVCQAVINLHTQLVCNSIINHIFIHQKEKAKNTTSTTYVMPTTQITAYIILAQPTRNHKSWWSYSYTISKAKEKINSKWPREDSKSGCILWRIHQKTTYFLIWHAKAQSFKTKTKIKQHTNN